MKIAHLLSRGPHNATGPINSVTKLAKALNKHTSSINRVYDTKAYEVDNYKDCAIFPIDDFFDDALSFDLVVFNGFFIAKYLPIAAFLKKNKINYIISPRSSFMRGGFRKSAFKKLAFLALSLRFLKNSAAIHFLTESELKNSFTFALPCLVCGNIVEPVKLPELRREKKIVYIGRYDVTHKGLDVFLSALHKCKDVVRSKQWRVMLFGPDSGKGYSRIMDFIERHDMSDIVSVNGPVFDTKKNELLCSSKLFIHTSRYEGQPQAVMEAMYAGCAILVTPGTNMDDIVSESGCGWVSLLNDSAISEALVNVMNTLDSDLLVKASSANAYALSNFCEEKVAREFVSRARELCGVQPAHSC